MSEDLKQKAMELVDKYNGKDRYAISDRAKKILIPEIVQAFRDVREADAKVMDELLIVSKRVLDAVVTNPDKMSGSLMDELEAAIKKTAAIRSHGVK